MKNELLSDLSTYIFFPSPILMYLVKKNSLKLEIKKKFGFEN